MDYKVYTCSCFSLSNNKQLAELYLRGNNFTRLPSVVYKLENLKHLDISDNRFITSIDKEILKLDKLEVFKCHKCEFFQYPPYAVCELGLAGIKIYFVDLAEQKGVRLTEIPLAIVGNSLSGKTSLAQTLQKGERTLTYREEKHLADETTRVFNVTDLALEGINLKIIDFGGNEIYHLAYQLALKPQCIPLFVVSIEEFANIYMSRGAREAARRVIFDWISHLYLACPLLDSPILVLTHIDRLNAFEMLEVTWKELLLKACKDLRKEMLDEEECMRPDAVCKLTATIGGTTESLLTWENLVARARFGS